MLLEDCGCNLHSSYFLQGGKKKNKMKKKMLNTLLSYTILRLKEKVRYFFLFFSIF